MIDLKTLSKTLSPQKQQDLQALFTNVPQALLEEAKMIQIPQNTTFIDAGEEASSIYILIKGRVKAADYRISEVVYDYTWFEPIELFGAMEFYMGYDQYITTLITTTDCTLITFPSGIFQKWLETDVPTLLDQIRIMLNRLHDQSRKERAFMFLSGRERLMYLLIQIYREHGRQGECMVQLTQEELANHAGINLRTATRAIHQLCKDGSLTKRARKLYLDETQCAQMEQQLKTIME